MRSTIAIGVLLAAIFGGGFVFAAHRSLSLSAQCKRLGGIYSDNGSRCFRQEIILEHHP